MNCIEFRRLLLADPVACTHEQAEHLAQCAACAAFARDARRFEEDLHGAIDVPAPQGLTERILLRRRTHAPAFRIWAIAASLFIGIGIGFYLYGFLRGGTEPVRVAAELGDAHPAVAAITYVVDHEARLLREGRSGDTAVLRDALTRLGLKLPSNGVTVRYLGKCPVPSGTGEHVVLQTALGKVTLILVPDHPLGPRVMVADRQMAALTVSVRTGGYILVADSVDHLRRIEKALM